VLPSGAVHPDGFGVVNHDGENLHHAVLGGHGAGIDASHVGHDFVDWLAGVAEQGLRHCVALRRLLATCS